LPDVNAAVRRDDPAPDKNEAVPAEQEMDWRIPYLKGSFNDMATAEAPMGRALRERTMAIVVEDDQDQADLAAVLLEEAEFDVKEVASAEDAKAILEANGARVALVFADVWLNRSADGIALARAIAERWPWIKLIVTSGQAGPALDELPRSAVYMQKPWRALDLLVEAERAGRFH
jgi:CheY-like chemotaxis protein